MSISDNSDDANRSKKTQDLLREKTPWIVSYGTYIIAIIMIIVIVLLVRFLKKYGVVLF